MTTGGGPGQALDRARIVALLEQLDRRIQGLGVSAHLYVVGGAAVAVTVADRRVTRDVDVAGLDAVVRAQAEAIAREEGLPTTWLNAAAAPWIPALVARTVVVPATPGLVVDYAPAEHLLAMKMVALRQQDAPDIAALAHRLGLRESEEFSSVLRAAYAGEGVLPQVLGVPDEQVNDEVKAIAGRVAAFVRTTPTGENQTSAGTVTSNQRERPGRGTYR
jgi:hypothetical protein